MREERWIFQFIGASFRPAIVFESLGGLKEIAWQVGKRLAEQYSGDRNKIAEQVFSYVRDHVVYTPDSDQFGYDEYARNADEVALETTTKGLSRGDCEDYAILLSVMFYAAGFRSSIVLAPGHAATLVHLPDYLGANVDWKLEGKRGWVWAEATGRTNPLGWTPSTYIHSDLLVYEIKEENIFAAGKAERPVPSGEGTSVGISPFSMLFFFWLFPRLFRK